MECKKCGKKVTKGTKFCTNCGEEVIFEEKKTTSTKAAKAVEARAEKVEAVKVEEPKKEVKKESNGLAIAGMVLGIVGLVFTLILNVASILIFLLPLLGLIFSIVAKGKKGFKIAGLVTSIIAIILEVLFLLLGIFVFSSFMSIFGEYIGNSSRGEDPHGRWVCAPFSSTSGSYNTDVNSVDDEDKTVLQLGEDGRYVYGPFLDTDNNHYAGYYTYDIEYDKNEENISNGYKFIEIDGDVDEYINKGIKGSTYNKSLDMEMELFRDYNYDKAMIIFTNTYNMYICER